MNDKRKRRKVAKAKMFSFHKPKVYRSSTGCCICKAKSSSSRFTDSKKYEEDFIKCFQLEERRTGEICNACVLLVKRWKKLPVGSSRNWRHVVDARAGPGIKSLTKFKAKNKKKTKDTVEKLEKVLKKKHIYSKNDPDREGSPAMSDESEENLPGNGSKNSSRACSPASSEDNGVGEKRLDMDQDMEISDYIDMTYFKRKKVCCGIIFVGMCGEVLIEPAYYKPCLSCLARKQHQRQQLAASLALTTSSVAGSSPTHSSSSASASPCHSSASASPAHSVDSVASSDGPKTKGFVSDSSSDSGYDESSNPGDNKKPGSQQPPPAPPSAMMLQLLTKPATKIQQQQHQSKLEPISAAATALRLKGLTSGTKVPIKLLCKPVALVSSAKLSLAGGGTMSADTVLTVVPPAVDFAVRPPPQRPSLAN